MSLLEAARAVVEAWEAGEIPVTEGRYMADLAEEVRKADEDAERIDS